MNKNLTIRAYKTTDKDNVLAILTLNIPECFAEGEIEELEDYLEHKVEKYFVAAIEDRIIGAGGINFDNNGKTAKIKFYEKNGFTKKEIKKDY